MTPCVCVNMDIKNNPGSSQFAVNTNYLDSVAIAGAEPLLTPCLDINFAKSQACKANAFLFIGGRDYHPESYGEPIDRDTVLMDKRRNDFDLILMRLALDSGKPILGVCGGTPTNKHSTRRQTAAAPTQSRLPWAWT